MLTVAGCGEVKLVGPQRSSCYKAMVSLVSLAANMTDSVSETWQEKHCDTVWFGRSDWLKWLN